MGRYAASYGAHRLYVQLCVGEVHVAMRKNGQDGLAGGSPFL